MFHMPPTYRRGFSSVQGLNWQGEMREHMYGVLEAVDLVDLSLLHQIQYMHTYGVQHISHDTEWSLRGGTVSAVVASP